MKRERRGSIHRPPARYLSSQHGCIEVSGVGGCVRVGGVRWAGGVDKEVTHKHRLLITQIIKKYIYTNLLLCFCQI